MRGTTSKGRSQCGVEGSQLGQQGRLGSALADESVVLNQQVSTQTVGGQLSQLQVLPFHLAW